MITYADIQSYVDAGKTDAEIAAILSADPRTVKAIDLGELLFLLNMRGMLVRLIRPADSGEKWSGSIVNMLAYFAEQSTLASADPANPVHEMNRAAQQWFSHITNDRNVRFDTADIQFATLFDAIIDNTAGQPNMPTAEDYAAVIALGGGYKYAGATAQAVADARAAHAAELARQASEASMNAAIARADGAAEAARASYRAGDAPAAVTAAAEAAWGAA